MKKLKFLILSLLCLLVATGCSKTATTDSHMATVNYEFSSDMTVSIDDAANDKSIFITNSQRGTTRYDNNDLCFDATLKFRNFSLDNINLSLKGFTAYGNDELLEEKVYDSYLAYLTDSTTSISDKSFVLKAESEEEVNFAVVIPEGNTLADIDVKFTLNNVNVTYCFLEEEQTSFQYVHDPSYNSTVLKDAVKNSLAVYGYVPSVSGSLKSYSQYDWTDEEAVAGYKESRIEYIETNDATIKALENKLRAEGKTIEEIATACSNLRNQNRLDAYKDDPEGLAALKARNLEKYGHEEGPLASELYEKYGSWEMVLEKSYSSNRAMDAICGVYDKYFYMYR